MNRKSIIACTLLVVSTLFIPAGAGVNSWTLNSPEGGSIRSIAVHPTRPDVILATSNRGLHRSEDGGDHWTLVRDDLSQANNVLFDPQRPDDAYIAYGYVYRSSDAGLTWSRVGNGTQIGADNLSIAANGDLFAASRVGGAVYRSVDRGDNWTALPVAWTGQQPILTTLTTDPNNAATVFVTIDFVGTFKSIDRGQTWSGPIADSPGTTVASPSRQWVFSLAVQPGNSSRVVAGTSGGILVSNDGGATWTMSQYFDLAFWIGFDPFDSSRAMAFTNMGVWRSTDGGANWPPSLADARIHTASYDAAPDPSTPNRIWIAGADGPLRSNDWGDTVSLHTTGIHSGHISDFTAADDGTIHAAFMSGPRGVYVRTPTGWQPRNNSLLYDMLPSIVQLQSVSTPPAHPDILYVANYFGGLATSIDGGNSWRSESGHFQNPVKYVQRVVADPTSSTGAVAYAATVQHGLWKTSNTGLDWTRAAGLPNYIRAIAVDPADGRVVYAAGGEDGRPDNLYKSIDAGLTWAASGTLTDSLIEHIAVDPSNSNVVYALGRYLFKSTNGGASWVQQGIGTAGNFVNGRRLLIDPVRNSTLFLVSAAFPTAFMRSVDGGQSWETITYPSPAQFTFLDSAILDPLHPNVFIGGANNVGIVEYEVATDLAVSVTGATAPFGAGGSAQIMLSVSNPGMHSSSLATVHVTLPAWLTATLPAGCVRGGTNITCERAPVRAGQTVNIPLTLLATDTPSTGQLRVSVEGHETDPVAANNQVTLNVSSTEQADLELALAASTLTPDRGSSPTLTATLTNRGPSTSTQTQLTLNLPAGLSARTITPSVGTCSSTALTITCALGTLAVNAAPTVSVTLDAQTIGSLTMEGRADGAGADTDTDQNATLAFTVRPVGDAGVQLADTPGPVPVNGGFRYTATVRNLGPDPGPAVLTFTLNGATVTAAAAAGGACTITATTANCNLNFLASGDSVTVNVDASSSAPGTASVTATVAFGGSDPNTTNNSATASTQVRVEGNVGVTVADSVDPATTNLPYNYTVTVTNAGPNAGGVNVSIPVTGATVTGATVNGGTCSSTVGTATCDITSLASGASAAITVNVSASAAGTASATATATFSGTDPVTTNNAATATTTVNVPPAPTPPRSGGGGGGRFDWLLAALLGLLAWRRTLRA